MPGRDDAHPRRRTAADWLPAVLTATVAGGVAVHAALLRGPAEWRWEYARAGLGGGSLVLAILLAAASVWLGGGRSFAGRGALLATPLAAALSLSVIGAETGGWQRVLDALASPPVFGYVFDSGIAPPTAELLADYPAASAALSMHSRTHPPGPILGVRALDTVVRALPLPATGALAAPAAAALEREGRRARDHGRPAPDHSPSPWTLVVLAWLLPCLGAAVAWPLAVLARDLDLPVEASSLAVALWLLVPARTVFTPSLDQALPLGFVGAAVLARRGMGGAIGAGALAGALLLMSYGCLPWLPLLLALAYFGRDAVGLAAPFVVRDRVLRAAGFLAGLVVPLALLEAATGFNVLASLRAALERHHAMAIATRSYGAWLWGNPADFALLLGPGIVALLLAGALGRARTGQSAAARGTALLVGGLFGVLWVSGSVRGEVGRIWLFFMPFACLFAAPLAGPGLARRALLAAEALLLFALAANLVFVA